MSPCLVVPPLLLLQGVALSPGPRGEAWYTLGGRGLGTRLSTKVVVFCTFLMNSVEPQYPCQRVVVAMYRGGLSCTYINFHTFMDRDFTDSP